MDCPPSRPLADPAERDQTPTFSMNRTQLTPITPMTPTLTPTVPVSLTIEEVRHLANLASHACAVLLPLSADLRGRDHHGGAVKDPSGALGKALGFLVTAGSLAASLRCNAMDSSVEGWGK